MIRRPDRWLNTREQFRWCKRLGHDGVTVALSLGQGFTNPLTTTA
jgi:hypothetical protein